MPDEVTASGSVKKSSSAKEADKSTTGPQTVEDTKPEQDVLIPVVEDEAAEDTVDHNAKIHEALDAARDAMIEGGMSVSDADAFLNSARPRGVSTVTGNYADLQRMTGLPDVAAAPVREERLQFAHKLDKDAPVVEPTEAQAKELKASAALAASLEKETKK